MQAGAVSLGLVFANDQQNVIPHFQRPYVWDQERNWFPLWEDIRQAADEVASETESYYVSKDKRTYFLGAMVLQHRPKPPQRVFLWNVIDGQQRLTTLQVLIAAARAVALEIGSSSLAANFTSMIENKKDAIHENFPEDLYKVWPLPQDRTVFLWAVSTAGTNGPAPSPHHRIVQARAWFESTIRDWASETGDTETRLYHLLETLKNRMQLVQITLDSNDDPQVIFEVLNHRGVPLDAADLVKNLLFQQFDQTGHAAEADKLLIDVWQPLDMEPWRDEITRGRVRRKRVDILLSYWLTIETCEEVPVEHLYSDFKAWMLASKSDVADVIRSIRHYADHMEKMRSTPLTDPLGQLLDRMEAAQTTTPWPLLLYLYANDDVPTEQRQIAVRAIDSYLMRRSICRWTTKDYNRLFLQVLTTAKAADPLVAGDTVLHALLSQQSDSRRWPSNHEFEDALMVPNLFHAVTRARLKSMLLGIEHHLHTDKTEPTPLFSYSENALNVEHLLPQSWEKNWPLGVAPGDPDYDALHEKRRLAVHQLGNLTLTTSKLNPSMSNKAWSEKKKAIQKHSLLRLTTSSVLTAPDGVPEMDDHWWSSSWDEDRIHLRGEWLRDRALQIWPRPDSPDNADDTAIGGADG
jgi:hypothetical protein